MDFTTDTRYDSIPEDMVGGGPDTQFDVLAAAGFNALIAAVEPAAPAAPLDSPIYIASRADPAGSRELWTTSQPMVLRSAVGAAVPVDVQDEDGNTVTITPTSGGQATVSIPANVILPLPGGDKLATNAFLEDGLNAMGAVFGIPDVSAIQVGIRESNSNNYVQVDPQEVTS